MTPPFSINYLAFFANGSFWCYINYPINLDIFILTRPNLLLNDFAIVLLPDLGLPMMNIVGFMLTSVGID